MKKETKYTVRHFKLLDGKKVEFNPSENRELANRCKLALAHMVTGKEHVLVNKS
ncbi:hypothetical protein [Gracilibacillus lacisalsi]|uniref:hypothetical protein n=1 Tax=Gracilibacillus lacisalsi TaxID=393087 RepID=UPI00036CA854|nr:hypothetical protein [Gracilibacillus lacisalsi]